MRASTTVCEFRGSENCRQKTKTPSSAWSGNAAGERLVSTGARTYTGRSSFSEPMSSGSSLLRHRSPVCLSFLEQNGMDFFDRRSVTAAPRLGPQRQLGPPSKFGLVRWMRRKNHGEAKSF